MKESNYAIGRIGSPPVVMDREPMNTPEQAAIESIRSKLEDVGAGLNSLNSSVSSMHTTVTEMRTEQRFYIKQQEEHGVRIGNLERTFIEFSNEIRDNRNKADLIQQNFINFKEELERRENAARTRQTVTLTVIQMSLFLLFSLINLWIRHLPSK